MTMGMSDLQFRVLAASIQKDLQDAKDAATKEDTDAVIDKINAYLDKAQQP